MKIYLRADADTPHRYVNRVMEACAEAGVFDLIFASNKD
jgi:biopolymer transport protein ExbD